MQLAPSSGHSRGDTLALVRYNGWADHELGALIELLGWGVSFWTETTLVLCDVVYISFSCTDKQTQEFFGIWETTILSVRQSGILHICIHVYVYRYM